MLELPKFSVTEKRIPTTDPDVWLNDRIIQQKAMRAYKDSMTPLEWALNSWYVPIFGTPPSARARNAYENRRLTDQLDTFARLAKVGELTGAKDAALDQAVTDMQRASDWQSRPAGEK